MTPRADSPQTVTLHDQNVWRWHNDVLQRLVNRGNPANPNAWYGAAIPKRCTASDLRALASLMDGADPVSPAEGRTDTERLDWLEAELESERVGNGICIWPITRTMMGEGIPRRNITLTDIGDEDGSSFNADLAEGPTLREAIDAAMQSEGSSGAPST